MRQQKVQYVKNCCYYLSSSVHEITEKHDWIVFCKMQFFECKSDTGLNNHNIVSHERLIASSWLQFFEFCIVFKLSKIQRPCSGHESISIENIGLQI